MYNSSLPNPWLLCCPAMTTDRPRHVGAVGYTPSLAPIGDDRSDMYNPTASGAPLVEASYHAIKRGVVHVQLSSELPAIFINVTLGLCRQCLQLPSEEGHKSIRPCNYRPIFPSFGSRTVRTAESDVLIFAEPIDPIGRFMDYRIHRSKSGIPLITLVMPMLFSSRLQRKGGGAITIKGVRFSARSLRT